MSFIYDDPKLVDKLLLDALNWHFKFTKEGQAAVADEEEQNRNVLLGMIKNLQSQLDPNKASAAQVSWEGDHRPTMDSSTLESLGDLVKWMGDNKITINGQRVVFPGNENPNQKGWILYRLETHTAAPEQRGAAPGGFFVNPELLKSYVQQLQAYQQQNPNKTMQFQLGNIIREISTDLGVNISHQYQAPEKTLRDTEVLDNVPQLFSTVEHSGYGGDVPLTYGDLKDELTFNAWLKGKGIQWSGEIEGKPARVPAGAPGFDACGVLKILMYRATHQMATDQESKNKSQLYARQVSVVAKAYNCDLSGVSSGAGAGGATQQQQGGAAAGNQQALVNEIVDGLPLALQNIDFSRINTFFDKITQLMGNNPTVMSYISNTKGLMQKASALTVNNDSFVQLGISPQAVVNMLKPNARTGYPAANFFGFVSILDQIVDNVRAVVGYFMAAYASKVTDQQRAFIYGQIGRRPDDSSIYSRNIEYLNNWQRTSTR